MASYRAIEATCDAVVELLRDSYPTDLPEPPLQFRVFTRNDFTSPGIVGVSLFLYRIYVDGSERSPEGRVDNLGRRLRPQLPVQLHFLLTAWAPSASLQHFLSGWMMRTMEDYPVLPAGLLNRRYGDDPVFRSDETVELSTAPMATDELFGLWDQLGPDVYELSVPYQARGIRIESGRELEEYDPVQTRTQRLHSGEPVG